MVVSETQKTVTIAMSLIPNKQGTVWNFPNESEISIGPKEGCYKITTSDRNIRGRYEYCETFHFLTEEDKTRFLMKYL